jgi:hypothetical protein
MRGACLVAAQKIAEPTPVATLTPDELAVFQPGSTVAGQLDA